MNQSSGLLQRRLIPVLTVMSDNTCLASIRAGMVAIVPLTILGGLFTAVCNLPVAGWDKTIGPYLPLLQVPVTATFGLLAMFVCFAIAYDLGKRMRQEAIISASMAALVFLMLQIDLKTQTLTMANLGSAGLFTAILVALITVSVQKYFTERNLVIRLPASVPEVVSESFL